MEKFILLHFRDGVCVAHSVDDNLVSDLRHLFFVHNGTVCTFEPPFDVQDSRFGIPNEVGIFHTSMIIIFLKSPEGSYNILIYDPSSYPEISLFHTTVKLNPDNSKIYHIEYHNKTYHIEYHNKTYHIEYHNKITINESNFKETIYKLDLLNKPGWFKFELDTRSLFVPVVSTD